MPLKAVYSSCALACYATRDGVERMLAGEMVSVPLVTGRLVVLDNAVSVVLSQAAIDVLQPLYAADRAVFDSIPRKPSGKPRNSLYTKKKVRAHAKGN